MRSLACPFSYVTSCTSGFCPISRKWIFTASFISTSINVAPRHFMRFTALSYVLSVVPNPGIVTAAISLWSFPSRSKAFTVTRSASVESRPPDIPITAVLQLVCSNRFFSPIAWIIKISSQRLSLSFLSAGTKGAGFTYLVSAVSCISSSNSAHLWSSSTLNVVILRRSVSSLSTSNSL